MYVLKNVFEGSIRDPQLFYSAGPTKTSVGRIRHHPFSIRSNLFQTIETPSVDYSKVPIAFEWVKKDTGNPVNPGDSNTLDDRVTRDWTP